MEVAQVVEDARWVARTEDLRQLRADIKADMQAFGIQLSNVGSQLTRLEVSLPLTYVPKPDLRERLKDVTDECDRRDQSNKAYIVRLESTIQRLLFVVLGALITGSLALLNEIFHLLGHTP